MRKLEIARQPVRRPHRQCVIAQPGIAAALTVVVPPPPRTCGRGPDSSKTIKQLRRIGGPDGIAGQTTQYSEQTTRPGRSVTRTEIKRGWLLLLGVAHQAAVANLRRPRHRVPGRGHRRVEILRIVGPLVQPCHQIAHAGAAVCEVRSGERERHVGHECPASAVGCRVHNIQQTVRHGDSALEHPRFESVVMRVEKGERRPGRAYG